MKLQQLRYISAVVQNGFNVTAAAEKLHTSQPGVSKQIRLLEEELGIEIFTRDARGLSGLTPEGKEVVARSLNIMRETGAIAGLGAELRHGRRGSLAIGTTHTQARYMLPAVIRRFRDRYPEVKLHLHQGTSEQIAELATLDRIDFAIATGSEDLFADFVRLPCYRWWRRLVVPREHALASKKHISMDDLAAWPLITYVFSFRGPSSLRELFAREGLEPNVSLTARDADVIKTYVRHGLGVGLVASVAIEPGADDDLASIDVSHLFPAHTTWIGFHSGSFLRGYMFDFITMFAPHLTREFVERARTQDERARAQLMSTIELPEYGGPAARPQGAAA